MFKIKYKIFNENKKWKAINWYKIISDEDNGGFEETNMP